MTYIIYCGINNWKDYCTSCGSLRTRGLLDIRLLASTSFCHPFILKWSNLASCTLNYFFVFNSKIKNSTLRDWIDTFQLNRLLCISTANSCYKVFFSSFIVKCEEKRRKRGKKLENTHLRCLQGFRYFIIYFFLLFTFSPHLTKTEEKLKQGNGLPSSCSLVEIHNSKCSSYKSWTLVF